MFTKEELLAFNEVMLGRGVPVEEDGVGYNKADYSACAIYFNGLSNAQYADLAKRLVKYSQTQLNVDKDKMRATAEHFEALAGKVDKNKGVSLKITENGTTISFRYNPIFVETIRKQPARQWDGENKNWIVPNSKIIPTLLALKTVGADVDNAIEYANNFG